MEWYQWLLVSLLYIVVGIITGVAIVKTNEYTMPIWVGISVFIWPIVWVLSILRSTGDIIQYISERWD